MGKWGRTVALPVDAHAHDAVPLLPGGAQQRRRALVANLRQPGIDDAPARLRASPFARKG